MARFIAIPKQDTTLSMLNMADVCLSRKARAQQIKRLKKARNEVERLADRVKRITRAVRGPGAVHIAAPHKETPITGITILEGKLESLNDLRNSLPDHDIIEDLPLTLVPPTKTGESEAAAVDVDTWHLEAIQLVRARRSGFKGTGKGVGIAILDTGVQEVAEINGRVKSAFEFNDKTEKIDAIATRDTLGHGTHVAGLVAGSTVGVAPQAEIMNFIMIPGGQGNMSDFILAIEFVANRPEISILNMSAGIPGYHDGMKAAIAALLAVGVLPIIAIGNEGANTSRSPGNYTEVLSIGASTKQDKGANFSSGGTMVVNSQSYVIPDMVAPGKAITSCVMGGGYESWNGTSMATPIVSGLAALIIEKNPNISQPDLRGELLDAVRSLPGIPAQRQGDGLSQLPQQLWFQGV